MSGILASDSNVERVIPLGPQNVFFAGKGYKSGLYGQKNISQYYYKKDEY